MDIIGTDSRLAWHNVAEWVPQPLGLRPQRMPERWRVKCEEGAAWRAMQAAGMSLRFRTNSRQVGLRWSLESALPDRGEVYCQGRFVADFGAETPARLHEDWFVKANGAGWADWEILPPWSASVQFAALMLDDQAELLAPVPARRRLMMCYGDSITQGYCATTASRTWPHRLGLALDWDMINMGFGGAAFCEKEVAGCLAERTDWEAFTMAAGINTAGGGRETASAFHQTYTVFIDTLRAAHPQTPILCVTPFFLKDADDRPEWRNGVGCCVAEYRQAIESVVRERQARGDRQISLLDGLSVIGSAEHLADTVHPHDAGMQRVADVFAATWRKFVLPRLP